MTDSLTRAVYATLMPGFAGPSLPAWVESLLQGGLGSVCLFATNIVDADQLRRLNAAIHAANPECLVAVDEEGGDVSRLHHREGSPYPAAAWLGRADDTELTAAVGAAIGAELSTAGVDLNLAPVADVNSNPRNPVIGIRSFSSDPAVAARHVAAYTTGLQAAGVAACAKHFPGHGDTSSDSHRELPTIDVDTAVLHARELVPFRAAISVDTLAVMTSHIMVPQLDPELPATLSGPVLDVLRNELGFEGVIVSDALDMAGASDGRGIPEAAVLALAAGCDLLCIGSDNTGEQMSQIAEHVLQAIRSGRLSEARVRDAAHRVQRLAAVLAARRNTSPQVPTKPIRLEPGVFWTRDRVPALTAPLLLRLDSAANIAAGETVWGLAEHLCGPIERALPGAICATVGDLAGLASIIGAHPGRPVVAQGRDFARVAFLAEAAALLRCVDSTVLLVEEGWHDIDGDPAVDIATFGSGTGTMLALLTLIAEGHE